MKYKVKNKLEQPINYGSLHFEASETKELNFAPESDRFEVTEIIEKKIVNRDKVTREDK